MVKMLASKMPKKYEREEKRHDAEERRLLKKTQVSKVKRGKK
jgi:hypothetical protein